jgi:hypothetical protein
MSKKHETYLLDKQEAQTQGQATEYAAVGKAEGQSDAPPSRLVASFEQQERFETASNAPSSGDQTTNYQCATLERGRVGVGFQDQLEVSLSRLSWQQRCEWACWLHDKLPKQQHGTQQQEVQNQRDARIVS